ncbi:MULTISPECIES: prenyltransferase/squalene oxidase repeat-containing protein [unclassified Streptomyces]|uniref:prenyltransferase/squalene oxidase repeat-containing protein n=1 Tax=unclassified Streptomyces TaxID=2593676 RepID=UPI0022561798|nr:MULTISPECIES: prenyltransferase/squalene oxidase repeat-containing protein [unclassified Streptomyces]MCX4525658.1 terpene cyclase/mutase family protein [Streptomyces sp. NBC_01551]MCX4543870.1 terpene cyclase/mutase family protein [Streptomyces sp. NBC_01565]
MNVRRSAAALAASAVLCVGAAPAALAAPSPSPAPVIPSGLYGKNDPTYDGVWRQSFALLAQDTVGLRPAKEAVDWLVGQQCAEGGFAAFRADATAACDAKTMLDTNATAAAVQALTALGGQDAAVKKGVAWLKSVQNEDGGWSYVPGTPSEASSTSVVISALAQAGEKPADVKSKAGKSAYDGLLAFQLGCSAEPAADRGAFGYQPADGKLPANADATAAAALAALGKGAVVPAPSTDTPATALACPAASPADPAAAAQGAAGYLAEALKKDGHLTAVTPGADQPTPDIGNTADAVIALAAAGHKQSATGALEWLKANSAEWSKGNPAALATLILASHATGTNPVEFGGTDLVAALNATGPAPQTPATGGMTKDEKKKDEESSSSQSVWWIVGAGAAAGIGFGILLSGRRKKNQL